MITFYLNYVCVGWNPRRRQKFKAERNFVSFCQYFTNFSFGKNCKPVYPTDSLPRLLIDKLNSKLNLVLLALAALSILFGTLYNQ